MEEKGSASSSWPAIVHARLSDLHRADARGDRPLGQVAVADHLAVAALIPEVFMLANPLGDFGFDGRREHRLSALAKDVGQHVTARGWKRDTSLW